MIKNGHVPSMLLYGEPGIGKTSLAHAIAGTSNLPFIAMNATVSGKKDVEDVVAESRITGKVLLFLMKFIALINYNKIHYCHMSKAAQSS